MALKLRDSSMGNKEIAGKHDSACWPMERVRDLRLL
jgi:hypothetical protein